MKYLTLLYLFTAPAFAADDMAALAPRPGDQVSISRASCSGESTIRDDADGTTSLTFSDEISITSAWDVNGKSYILTHFFERPGSQASSLVLSQTIRSLSPGPEAGSQILTAEATGFFYSSGKIQKRTQNTQTLLRNIGNGRTEEYEWKNGEPGALRQTITSEQPIDKTKITLSEMRNFSDSDNHSTVLADIRNCTVKSLGYNWLAKSTYKNPIERTDIFAQASAPTYTAEWALANCRSVKGQGGCQEEETALAKAVVELNRTWVSFVKFVVKRPSTPKYSGGGGGGGSGRLSNETRRRLDEIMRQLAWARMRRGG